MGWFLKGVGSIVAIALDLLGLAGVPDDLKATAEFWSWIDSLGARAALLAVATVVLILIYGPLVQRWRERRKLRIDLARWREAANNNLFNRKIATDPQLSRLEADWTVWHQSVGDYIANNLGEDERVSFSNIGSMKPKRFAGSYNGRHDHIRMQIELQMLRLENLRQRYMR